MNVILAQINPIIGNVKYNLQKVITSIEAANASNADAVILPELVLTGYPPRDLLFREDLIEANIVAKDHLINEVSIKYPNLAIAFGYVARNPKQGQNKLLNSAMLIKNGEVLINRDKMLLPTYDVFEEDRYFAEGEANFPVVEIAGKKVGLIICEEAWNDSTYWKDTLYAIDPVKETAKNGADTIFCLNASPYRRGVNDTRLKMIGNHCKNLKVDFFYVNQVGYQDEVGFDGNSFAMNKDGIVTGQATPFQEDLYSANTNNALGDHFQMPWQQEMILALSMGIKDYFGKLNITGPAIIGLSGGIDSAIVAFLAAMALGKERVIAVGMPSEYSSEGSITDAEKIANKLGIHFALQPIAKAHDEFRFAVDSINMQLLPGKDLNEKANASFLGKPFIAIDKTDLPDQNIQPRVRMIYLMALSNYYNGLVLSTGNKSEMAVGYCTMYGDMAGGLAVISDVLKTEVYDICRWINENFRDEIIPWNTINKPPSAELKPGQVDQESLPPYEILDLIVTKFVNEGKTPNQVEFEIMSQHSESDYFAQTGKHLSAEITRWCRAILRNEFKRKQAPTGLKVSPKLFKYGWTQPIVHGLL